MSDPRTGIEATLESFSGKSAMRPAVAYAGRAPSADVELGSLCLTHLCQEPSWEELPPLDRPDTDPGQLTALQRQWCRSGYVVLEGFMPKERIDPYCERWARDNLAIRRMGGYPGSCSYVDVPEMRSLLLYPPLLFRIEHLIRQQMGLHLALNGWISTERNWHQDDYLNPGFVNGWYAAVWIALEDIDPDSGPFQLVPGTHRWPLIRGDRVRRLLAPEVAKQRSWPKSSEAFLTELLERELAARHLEAWEWTPKKGDVLIWHARLLHRGSQPRREGLLRRTLIGHYSALCRRSDMPTWRRDPADGAHYFIPPAD